MRFAFTEDQQLFRDAIRDVLAGECTPEALRGAWENETGRIAGLWAQLGELGLLGLRASEDRGGLGMSDLDLVLPLEETGRVALPEPVLETTAVGIPLLEESAPDAVRDEWVPRAIAGDATITVGLAGASLVPDAGVADLLILERAGEIHAVPREAVSLEPQQSVDFSRRLQRVSWEPSDATRIASGDAARAATEEAFLRGALGASAQLVGLGARMIEITVEYAKVREQFRKPIGSFQAIKHHLVNALLAVEMARPVVYRAAWSQANGDPERRVHVAMAKARASDAARQVAKIALQVHGAIGYSFEYDLHLWMKRAWALAATWGDAAEHRARVASVVLDGAPADQPLARTA